MPVPLREEAVVKLHDWNIRPKPIKQPICSFDARRLAAKAKDQTFGPGPITWTVSDIAKAGCLLTTPPIATHFDDEQEMRRVYTLIYDVFRYKNIMNQALTDVSFFIIYPELNKSMPLVWLLLFDFYHRSFKKRETGIADAANRLFKICGLLKAEEALWSQRIKLAAAVARLRIKHSALKLNQLLPRHLRDDRICCQAKDMPVTCWINVKKVKSLDEISHDLQKLLQLKPVDDTTNLEPNTFKFDKLCPQFIVFHPSVRTKIAQSPLVQKHKLVVQDRSFCVGPATFGKVIENLQLTGCVIQSHVNSPRATAYLAALLSQNDKIKKVMAFSAGDRKKEYENYFNELGMNNITIFADKLIDMPPDAFYLQEAIAVFATPPNSYSAVSDPIDLVCSRGGDLSMLQVLTETEETTEGRQRVMGILEEQRKTLRFAMSRPQIQFVLYETHSELEAENNGMVQKAVKEINKLAKLHHATLQGKINVSSTTQSELLAIESREINNNEKMDSHGDKIDSDFMSFNTPITAVEHAEKVLRDIVVPDCDLFDVPNLPDLCPNEDSCLKLYQEGCFLALLQRKQVTRMDNKYLIQIAESRGLFGNDSSQNAKQKSHKVVRKKEVALSPPSKMRKKVASTEIKRISAPTDSFLRHSKITSSSQNECNRLKAHGEDKPQDEVNLYRHILTDIGVLSRRCRTISKKVSEKSYEELFMENIGSANNKYSEDRNAENELSSMIQSSIDETELEIKKLNLQNESDNESKNSDYKQYQNINPYDILKSLTSHQIRALICPSYNAQNDIHNTICTKRVSKWHRPQAYMSHITHHSTNQRTPFVENMWETMNPYKTKRSHPRESSSIKSNKNDKESSSYVLRRPFKFKCKQTTCAENV